MPCDRQATPGSFFVNSAGGNGKNKEKEMETKLNEVEINGVKYVPKDSIKKVELNTENYVIIRTYSAGVFAGNLLEHNERTVKLANARRLWYWDGAFTLSQLAMEGVSKPENCKFPCEVKSIILLDALEIIPCTEKAVKSIKGVKEWKA
jgi:hypothetical protein